MAMPLVNWVKDSAGVYFGNAATRRDFRSQLRGNKPVILWMVYLGIMVVVTGLAYDNMVRSQGSVASVQSSLSEFYQMVLGLLGVLIFVLAPSLTATTVVMERKRKSLDLVFSAPVTPKYYLVGKLLSSMRYVWMLLVLALPIAAVGVVMGGATWMDVLAAYMMLAGTALVATAFGLLMSVMAPSVVSAIAWTYILLAAYLWITGAASAISYAAPMMGRTTAQLEANWMIGISPFMVSFAAQTHTTVWGVEIPNWIIAVVYSLFVAKVLVLGAASAMSGYGAKETKSLRIHLIVGLGLASAMSVVAIASTGVASPTTGSEGLGRGICFVGVLLSLAVPIVSCYAIDADRRNRPDGWFGVRRTLLGTPSGALPFLWAMCLAVSVGAAAALWLGGYWPAALGFWQPLLWSAAYLFFWWSVARLTSTFAKSLKVARMLSVLMFIVIVALPLPALMILGSLSGPYGRAWDESLISLHMLFPIFAENAVLDKMAFYGFVTAQVGVVLTIWAVVAERRARKRLEVPANG